MDSKRVALSFILSRRDMSEVGEKRATESKRVALSGGGSRGGGDGRGGGERSRWAEGMSPEVLAVIFGRMPADVISRTVPFVCRGWREVVLGPYCWSDIDLEQWCRRVNRSDVIDSAVRRLVRRSRGTLRRLSAYRIGNSGYAFTVVSGNFLKVLQIPMSEVTDQIVEKHAGSLSALTFLDISYCLGITSKGIQVIGKHCKSLLHLRRNMPPPDFEPCQEDGVAAKVDEGEAFAIANTMNGLKHLELCFGRFSDHGLDAIITHCSALCFLDIRGSWNVKMEGDVVKKCETIKDFRYPWYDEYEDVGFMNDEQSKSEDDDASLPDVDIPDDE